MTKKGLLCLTVGFVGGYVVGKYGEALKDRAKTYITNESFEQLLKELEKQRENLFKKDSHEEEEETIKFELNSKVEPKSEVKAKVEVENKEVPVVPMGYEEVVEPIEPVTPVVPAPMSEEEELAEIERMCREDEEKKKNKKIK